MTSPIAPKDKIINNLYYCIYYSQHLFIAYVTPYVRYSIYYYIKMKSKDISN